MFRKSNLLNILTLAACIAGFAEWVRGQPNRTPAPPRAVILRADPVDTSGWRAAGGAVAGAWRMTTNDVRFGGLSGLAVERGRMIALTDSGATVAFAPPSSGRQRLPAVIADLPGGPGAATLKSARDSEAIAATTDGQWLVAFEIHHWAWLYPAGFQRGFWAISYENRGFRPNAGVEGLAMLRDGAILAFPEHGGRLLRLAKGTHDVREYSVRGLAGDVAEAALLPDGRLVVLRRLFRWNGLGTSIELIERDGRGYRARPIARLLTDSLANFEGATAALLPDGRTRLWMVTDDDFRASGRSLLVAFDFPRGQAGGTRN